MSQDLRFDEVVDAVDRLSVEEQETLSNLLHHRLRDALRKQFVERVRESRREFERGDFKQMTVEELMREVDS